MQAILHRELKTPVRVLTEPRYCYSMHCRPSIAEVNDARDGVLVRFTADAISGSFHGTCLYARHDGEWSCYTRFRNEMAAQRTTIATLGQRAREGTITLLCIEKEDDPHCHRHLLKKLIDGLASD